MPFSTRPFRRFSMPRSVTYHAGIRLTLPLAYCSAFWLLSMFLVLNSGPAYAEWVSVAAVDQAGVTIYVDLATIHRKGARVTMLELIDYRTIQTVAGTAFLSAKLQREYDCAGDRHRTLALTRLSGNMGTGKVLRITSDEQQWEPADPGSIGKRLWKFACDKQ
jgi:Surface-adhesin protein E